MEKVFSSSANHLVENDSDEQEDDAGNNQSLNKRPLLLNELTVSHQR